jgi:predicted tellurium resistance membrane protein TerC
MQTKHHVLLVGIVLSILLSLICSFLALQTFNYYQKEFFGIFLVYFGISWLVGGLVFYVIKKLFLESDTSK